MRSCATNNHMVDLPWMMSIDTGKCIKYIKLNCHWTSSLTIIYIIASMLAFSWPGDLGRATRSGKMLGVSSPKLYVCIYIYMWLYVCVCWYGYGMHVNNKYAYTTTPSQRPNASFSGIRVFPTVQKKTERRLKTWRSQSWKWSNRPTQTVNRPTGDGGAILHQLIWRIIHDLQSFKLLNPLCWKIIFHQPLTTGMHVLFCFEISSGLNPLHPRRAENIWVQQPISWYPPRQGSNITDEMSLSSPK